MDIRVNAKLDTRGFDRLLRNGPANNAAATERMAREILDDIKAHWSPVSPSEPGSPPAYGSGQLHRSGRVRHGASHWISRFRVVFEVGYAKFLELGTKRMAARPFLKPAVARMRKSAKKHYRALFRS